MEFRIWQSFARCSRLVEGYELMVSRAAAAISPPARRG
jgi:hypothetical protein